jgi:succinate dehydrogenase flavin-adding protein (antitoxin of CptAB toxin-antitoxin module)
MKLLKLVLAAALILPAFTVLKAQPMPPSKEHRAAHLKKALQLSDEQAEKVKGIFKATDAKLTELQSKNESTRDNEMKELDKIFAEQDREIEKILTDQQKKKYEKLREDMEGGGPEGFGPPPGDGPDGMPPMPPDDGPEPPFAE